jgi:DNA-binding response OmpR family regulator
MDDEKVMVVVVDDDADVRDSLCQFLVHDGYHATPAVDAAQARAVVAMHDAKCVLIDLGMPGTDGFTLARQLRAAHGGELVLVAVTGWTRDEDRRAAVTAGIDFVLCKPVEPDDLRRVLPPLR